MSLRAVISFLCLALLVTGSAPNAVAQTQDGTTTAKKKTKNSAPKKSGGTTSEGGGTSSGERGTGSY